ncbi:transposase [Mesorhizobium captivum]|uniref:transposase n=1 Tax=Mesorhizobium captivum TaxID=3072319 RepID=UPI003D319CC3
MTAIFLPSRSPELNPVENVWQYLRQNWLSNRVFDDYDAIIDAACEDWQKLLAAPETITSIGMRQSAHVGQTRDYDEQCSKQRNRCCNTMHDVGTGARGRLKIIFGHRLMPPCKQVRAFPVFGDWQTGQSISFFCNQRRGNVYQPPGGLPTV